MVLDMSEGVSLTFAFVCPAARPSPAILDATNRFVLDSSAPFDGPLCPLGSALGRAARGEVAAPLKHRRVPEDLEAALLAQRAQRAHLLGRHRAGR